MPHLRSALPALVTTVVVALGASAFALAGAGPATSASTPTPSGPVAELLADSYRADFGRLSVAGKSHIENKQSPVLTGKSRLGRTLTVSSGTWKPAKVKLQYRWYADSQQIKGAKGASYSPTRKDVGDELSVRVTAKKKGYRSASVSEQAGTVKPGKISSPQRPELLGKAVVGKALKVTTGSWSVDGVTVSYIWSRGSKAVSFSPRYRLRPADAGKRLKVVVSAGKRGYSSQSVRLKTPRIQAG